MYLQQKKERYACSNSSPVPISNLIKTNKTKNVKSRVAKDACIDKRDVDVTRVRFSSAAFDNFRIETSKQFSSIQTVLAELAKSKSQQCMNVDSTKSSQKQRSSDQNSSKKKMKKRTLTKSNSSRRFL